MTIESLGERGYVPLRDAYNAPAMPEAGPSPAWWVERLSKELDARRDENAVYRRYVDGDHDSPSLQEKASVAFQRIIGLAPTNLCGLIVSTTAEKLAVQGFRFGEDTDDEDAWAIWQENDFDGQSELLTTEALTVGRSFVMVEPPAQPGGRPRMYGESADQMIVAYAPGRRRERLAALKVFADEWTGDRFATLILPNAVHKMRSPARLTGSLMPDQWTFRDDRQPVEVNPLGTVPVFELRNRPQLDGTVRSEIHDVLADQDACNHIALNALVALEYGAFLQKWGSGIEIPVDPTTGLPIESFQVAIDRMFVTPNPDARFGDFGATDLTPIVGLYESRVKHMAAVSQTPLPVLMGVSNLAAEALALTISGHVSKVKRHQRSQEPAYEDALRCSFLAMGDERAFAEQAETIWVDPEIHSWAEVGDMASKLLPAGAIAPETFQEKYLGMSSVERRRDQGRRQQANSLGQLAAVLQSQGDIPPLPGTAND